MKARQLFPMLIAIVASVALLLTLWLPIYPEGLTPAISLFLGLAAFGAALGLGNRGTQNELVRLLPWAMALLTAFLVGAMHRAEPRQALEDTLPYVLFVAGLATGRATNKARWLVRMILCVCVCDTVVSLLKMPSLDLGVRSSYTYFKITAGLPLVGLFCVAYLRHVADERRAVTLLRLAAGAVLAVGVWMSISRGMMLGLVVGLITAAYVRTPTRWLLALAIGSSVLAIYASSFAEFGYRYLRFGSTGTVTARFREIAAAWAAFTQTPLLGSGLGTSFEVDGFRKAYVHNMLAYHLWKFGVVGCTLLAFPLLAWVGGTRALPLRIRATLLGGAASVLTYLTTCAAYKTYYLVWMLGVLVGAVLRDTAPLMTLHRPRT